MSVVKREDPTVGTPKEPVVVTTETEQPSLFAIGPSPVTERTISRILRPEEDALIGHMRGWCHDSKTCALCNQEAVVDRLLSTLGTAVKALKEKGKSHRELKALYLKTTRERDELVETRDRLIEDRDNYKAERDVLAHYLDGLED